MMFRRCKVLFIEPYEQVEFSFEALFGGDAGVVNRKGIRVWLAHLDRHIDVSKSELDFVFNCSSEEWQVIPGDRHSKDMVLGLMRKGILISDDKEYCETCRADEVVRSGHWWPLSAVYHRHGRWSGVDSVGEMERNNLFTVRGLVENLGVPPPEALPRRSGAIRLDVADKSGALNGRVTCRNYDGNRLLPLPMLALMLERVLGAQAVVETEGDVRFLKKNVPSAGGLHPLEAYVFIRKVADVSPGLYHYHPVAHELSLLPEQPENLDGFIKSMLAGQHWFSDAHVIVVIACRFERNFWKYRNHAKAYRAVVLDVGHVSQAFYTEATAQGLGAFVTAAVNEVDFERLLCFDPLVEGVLAVCGFGWRDAHMTTAELDPSGHVWRDSAR